MAEVIEGGELIELFELDQDECQQDFGVTCAGRLTAVTRVNLVSYSGALDQDDWVKTNVTVAANRSTAPEWQSETADEVTETTATGEHKIASVDFVPDGSNDINVSVYAEDNGRDRFQLVLYNVTEANEQIVGSFNLTAETATAGANANGATLSAVNNGYRCSADLTYTGITGWNATDTYRLEIRLQDGSGNTSYAGDDTKGMYFWGAQATEGSTLEDYQEIRDNDDAGEATTDDDGLGGYKCFKTRATCHNSPNYTIGTKTIRIGKPNPGLPKDQQIIPCLKDIRLTPSRLNSTKNTRNSPLGARARAEVSVYDGPSIDSLFDPYYDERISGAAQADGIGYDPDARGTLWANWRARVPYYLGRSARIKRGVVALASNLDQLDTRHYIIEGFSSVDKRGEASFTLQDPLKLADGDRAQYPNASQGRLLADISAVATSATIDPPSAADDYPLNGFIAIGKEEMSFTRTAGSAVLTLTRGTSNTEARAHSAGDTLQLVGVIDPSDAATIVELLLLHAGIDPAFIPTAQWAAEAGTYIPYNFSAHIVKPTPVNKLIGELAEQAGFSIWWDEVASQIPFSAVKAPGIGAITLDESIYLKNTLDMEDSPESRISTVWVRHGLISPTESETDENNYAVTQVSSDVNAGSEAQYNQDAVRKVNSRWIPAASPAADFLATRLLSRFRDIIREGKLTLPANYFDLVKMGDVHRLGSSRLVNKVGIPAPIDIRIMAVENRGADIVVDFEEVRFFSALDPDERPIPINSDTPDIHLPTLFQQVFATPPQATNIVTVTIAAGIENYATSTSAKAFDVGTSADWPAGITINIIVSTGAYITGAGGQGGTGANPAAGAKGQNGLPGGDALFTRFNVNVTNNGTIQSGGGGGAGGDNGTTFQGSPAGGSGGGGGAGRVGGAGGAGRGTGGGDIDDGSPGTLTAGGAEGNGSTWAGVGGNGGDPGQAGQNATTATGGAAGNAIDGVSYVTLTGNAVVGPTV